jgi:hypothetical protein
VIQSFIVRRENREIEGGKRRKNAGNNGGAESGGNACDGTEILQI